MKLIFWNTTKKNGTSTPLAANCFTPICSALQVDVESPNTVGKNQQEFSEVRKSTQKRGAASDSRVHISIQDNHEQSLARERALEQRIQKVERSLFGRRG